MSFLKIYHIEDDDDHAELVSFTLQKSSEAEIIYRSSDGEQALNVIGQICRKEVEAPDLILLDVNLPRLNGLEVLKSIKSRPELASIPVVAFTTSNSHKDKQLAYGNHINSYMTKPADYQEMETALLELITYWKNFNRV